MVISVAFAVITGDDSLFILGSKTMREKLDTDVMPSLEGKAQCSDIAIEEVPKDGGPRGGVSLRNVAMMIETMQAAGKIASDVKPRQEFMKDKMARGLEMFFEVGDEVTARRKR